uniref:Uncharacterized protein n=1 Tax=Ralstonia solanacearum TaxID=305 RepID=A0A0S4WTI5_RALSL|nr:protein of unknown function [Ralstonia solanacearum]
MWKRCTGSHWNTRAFRSAPDPAGRTIQTLGQTSGSADMPIGPARKIGLTAGKRIPGRIQSDISKSRISNGFE